MSTVITGEAVVLELRPAAFGARFLSALIDVAAQFIVIVGIILAVAGTLDAALLDPALTQALIIGLLVTVLVIIPVAVETLTRGKSLGRLVMGLRIVRDDGGSIRFRHAFIRGMLAVLEIYLLFGSLAFIVAVFNERSKRLGDILAGTYSMRERFVRQPHLLAHTPQELGQWIKLTDMGRLPDSLARRMSQFISQAPRMTSTARSALAVELADEASAFVAPPPPAGTAPEAFLNAVVAERRERDYARLAAQHERVNAVSERLHRLPFS